MLEYASKIQERFEKNDFTASDFYFETTELIWPRIKNVLSALCEQGDVTISYVDQVIHRTLEDLLF